MITLHSLAYSDDNASALAKILFPAQDSSGKPMIAADPLIDTNEKDDVLSNVTPLHIAATHNCIEVASLLILHAKELDDVVGNSGGGGRGNSSSSRGNERLRQLLTAKDLESGYNALHRALLVGNVQLACLIIEKSYLVVKWDEELDHEGLSPFGMLSQTLKNNLIKCRSDCFNSFSEDIPERSSRLSIRNRSSSFAQIEEDDNDVTRSATETNLSRPKNTGLSRSFGCEAVTFGRANHFGLGFPSFAQGNEQGSTKPKRVPAFATGNARSVAAAAYHSLILTKDGHVYTCGYGKVCMYLCMYERDSFRK